MPPAAAGKGLSVEIGCHTDALWDLDAWPRFPRLDRTEALDAVLRHQDRVVGQADHPVLPQRPCHGDLHRLAALGPHNEEHLGDGPAPRRAGGPPRKLFGHDVEAQHPAQRVAHNHPVANGA